MPDDVLDLDDMDHVPCPTGCGRTTDDAAGGPCSACWDALDDEMDVD